MDAKKKFMLFRRTKHFCSAPWNLLYVDTSGGIHTCTKGQLLGNLHQDDVRDIVQDVKLREIRSDILADVVTDNCARCISLENHGDGEHHYQHIRNMYNELFLDQDVDYTDTNVFQLGAVDLHWSSICDLRCITCWAKQSSSIALEQDLPVQHTRTETAMRLIDFIATNQSTLREVYLSGGEPTLIKYNLNLLERLDKRSDLVIRVNSNLMWRQDNQVLTEILKFPRVIFTCSADNLGTKFEYIRRGAQWSRFVDNLRHLQQHANVEIRVNSVFFVLTAQDLPGVIDYFRDHHDITNFTINQCGMGHTYYRCRNLDVKVKHKVRDGLEDLRHRYRHDLNLVGSINNCQQELDHAATECYRQHLDAIDQMAGTDWRHTWPELA